MCLYPRLIKNKKYTSNKKNGGNIPAISDKRTEYVPIGCGNCMECRKQKGRAWQIRMSEHIKTNKEGKFVTLTFSNEAITELQKKSIDEINEKIKKAKTHKEKEKLEELKTGYKLDNYIATYAVRRFLERYRKEHGKTIHHWLITELGHNGTENIHLHGIVWTNENITKHWQYGFVWIGDYVNERTVNYIVKYVTKIDQKHKNYTSKILTSSGIGSKYTETYNSQKNKYKTKNTEETYRFRNGTKASLPIYYRNKIYTDEEKEKLWIEKLDKQERWILGQRIDISETEEHYIKALKEAQRKNERLGYGKSEKNWSEIEYENNRRELMRSKRTVQSSHNN